MFLAQKPQTKKSDLCPHPLPPMATATTLLLSPRMPLPSSPDLLSKSNSYSTIITCGPRDNRLPINRGRTLSTEAILAVQSLKRNPDLNQHQNLSRLLVPDLVAALSELLRQDHPLLALRLLPFLRSEPPGYNNTTNKKPNLSLYADIIKSLSKNNHHGELDRLVEELTVEVERNGGIRKGVDLRGPARLLKSLVGAGKGDVAMRVYGLMKRGGCVPGEYLFGYLARGLRRLGDAEGARVVEMDYERWDLRGEWGVRQEEEEEEEEAVSV